MIPSNKDITTSLVIKARIIVITGGSIDNQPAFTGSYDDNIDFKKIMQKMTKRLCCNALAVSLANDWLAHCVLYRCI